MDPFDFFKRLAQPPLDRENLPPEAATLEGFTEAVEQMICALNILAKYDCDTMARVWNEKIRSDEWDVGPMEMRLWPMVVESSMSAQAFIERYPDLRRIFQDLSIARMDWPKNAGPEGLQ